MAIVVAVVACVAIVAIMISVAAMATAAVIMCWGGKCRPNTNPERKDRMIALEHVPMHFLPGFA